MPFIDFPLPPADWLSVELVIGGDAQHVFGTCLSLRVDGIDSETDAEHWQTRAPPSVEVMLLIITDDSWYRFKFPPAAFGLSLGSSVDLTEPQLESVDDAPASPRLMGRVTRSLFSVNAAMELQGELGGALGGVEGDGAAFTCRFSGTVLEAEALVLLSQGRERAEVWLKQAWPSVEFDGADQVEESRFGIGQNQALLLAWRPGMWADEQARQFAMFAASAEESRQRRDKEAAVEAAALQALRVRPVPDATPEAPLVAARCGHSVISATLSLFITWNGDPCAPLPEEPYTPVQGFSLELNIDVDEASGEDGALAPDFRFNAKQGPFGLPVHGLWQSCTAGEVEAWFGNDAPELEDNQFAWRFISPDEVEIDWTAHYDDWQTRQPERFHYRGRARVESIWLEAPEQAAVGLAAGTAFDAETLTFLRLGTPERRKSYDGDTWLAPVSIEFPPTA